MEKRFSVYKHTNKENGKVYIGITSTKPEYRWDNGNGYRGNSHLKYAIAKYGWDSFVHEILYSGLSKEEAQAMERKLIAEYEATNPEKGYNTCLGGEGRFGYVYSEEEKAKKREASLKAWQNPELRKAHSKKLKGISKSAETRRHMSEAAKGRVISEAQRKDISNTLKEYYSHEENRKWQSDLKTKYPVICQETQKVYTSSHDAHRDTGIQQGNIYACCLGKRKRAGGFHWSFVNSQANTEVNPGPTT